MNHRKELYRINNQAFISAVDWLEAGKHIDIDGLSIFIRQSLSDNLLDVNRPTLLLIHGFPSASWDWHKLWPKLAKHFNLIAIDMLGFGFSDKPRQHHYSIAEQADIQLKVLQNIGIDSCHLLVHDYGVSVAQELLARQKNTELNVKFESCLFLNGGLFHGVHRPLLVQKVLASKIGFLLSPFVSKATIRRSMQRIFSTYSQPTERDIDQLWQLISYQNGQSISHCLIKYMHERKRYYHRWVRALTDIKIPLRLVVGIDDPISGLNLAVAYRERIPEADVIELLNTGHYPQLENPRGVFSACQSFWSTVIKE